MIRFGKSSSALISHKRGFFCENNALLQDSQRIGALYREQPRRTDCKCCAAPLTGTVFFKQNIEYIICENCTHLNGAHEDSDTFCAAVYTQDGGENYAHVYSSSDKDAYLRRVTDIYVPKAEFLQDGLVEAGEDPARLTYADFGAGSGYFVSAMRSLGWAHSYGYEVSSTQTKLAAAMITEGAVIEHSLEETVDIAKTIKVDAVSMIGVLEHVQKPREILAALQANSAIKYLYISVPLFSPCVMLEAVFPNVMQRQLSAGHTHLFTEGSLSWMANEFGLKSLSEWWFGTDLVDLFRCVSVELERTEATQTLAPIWAQMMGPCLDDAQLSLDKRKTASEVHILFKFDK
jgi:hypothetical protein